MSRSLTQLVQPFGDAESHDLGSNRREWDLHRAWPKIAIPGRMLNADQVVAAAEQRFASR